MDVSVVVPVFNEESTLETIYDQIKETKIPKEIIFVDDGSTDATSSIIQKLQSDPQVKTICFPTNRGKGAAVIAGVHAADGKIVLLQDADLEYHPKEYEKLLKPIQEGYADIVYGARFLTKNSQPFYYLYYLANRVLTAATNLIYKSNLNDMETGYKVFKKDLFEKLDIKAIGFEFEPEFTAKVLKQKFRIFEVPIDFNPRSYSQGKKIRLRDAFIAIWTLVRIRFDNSTN